MKKTKVFRISCMVLTLVLMALLACSCVSEEKKLIGTWSTSYELLGTEVETSYTFNEDGTGHASIMGIKSSFTYTVDSGKITFTSTVLGHEATSTIEYSIKDDKLTITENNESTVFTKQN